MLRFGDVETNSPPAPPPALHEAVAFLAPLLGTWRGGGDGEYPTVDDFSYTEEVVIGHAGKPVLLYSQRTRRPDGFPLHAESGFVRPGAGAGDVEVVMAHPSGHVELSTGTFDGRVLDVASVEVRGTPTAKEVREVHRRFVVDGDTLTYDLAMAAVGQPLTHHLRATLRRVDAP